MQEIILKVFSSYTKQGPEITLDHSGYKIRPISATDTLMLQKGKTAQCELCHGSNDKSNAHKTYLIDGLEKSSSLSLSEAPMVSMLVSSSSESSEEAFRDDLDSWTSCKAWRNEALIINILICNNYLSCLGAA